MHEYGTSNFQFADSAARHIKESDIPGVINLFKRNYGDDYAIPEFYDDQWVKRGIYSDHIIWLVLEEEGGVVASGACVLDYGDPNDQIGEIGRVVVHPDRKGRGLENDSLLLCWMLPTIQLNSLSAKRAQFILSAKCYLKEQASLPWGFCRKPIPSVKRVRALCFTRSCTAMANCCVLKSRLR